MYVIARKAKTSTGVEYTKAFEPDKTTEMLSEAHMYYSEIFAQGVCAKLGNDFKVIKIK